MDTMKRLIFASLATLGCAGLAAPTPLPEALATNRTVRGTAPVLREIRPGVTYHAIRFANFSGDGPLSAHFIVIDWTRVDRAFTLAVVAGRDGNRARPSDLALETNAIAAVNGVFHQMTDPYRPFYTRKIAGRISPDAVHPGGDGCFAFNRGEMPYIGRFSTNALARYENLISADGLPAFDPGEAALTRAQRQKRRAPRTIAGNDTVRRLTVIAVADGRQKRSTGLTFNECRRLLEAWGCDQMTTLDGGGSSVMILKGADGVRPEKTNGACQIMNIPSDGMPFASVERRVSESLMLLD